MTMSTSHVLNCIGAMYLMVLACEAGTFAAGSYLFNIFLDMVSSTYCLFLSTVENNKHIDLTSDCKSRVSFIRKLTHIVF